MLVERQVVGAIILIAVVMMVGVFPLCVCVCVCVVWVFIANLFFTQEVLGRNLKCKGYKLTHVLWTAPGLQSREGSTWHY